MVRRTFLFLSQQSWLRHWMENSSLTRQFTRRFVAGRTLPEGIQAVRKLSQENISATLDFLGENVKTLEEAQHSVESYLEALEQIQHNHLPATVSIKLTQFGLDLSEQACLRNVAKLVEYASSIGTRVEIDMESSEYTDRTLAIVSQLQQQYPGSVRAVIQAYLYRSEADIQSLSKQGTSVRLCKGAYREPDSAAFPQKSDVDRNYLVLIKQLLLTGCYPAVASHDEAILQEVVRFVAEKNIPTDRFEFQMLYGIRADLQRKLVADGFHLSLYVPYGNAWYPYFMRRLAERPANLLFLAKNLMPR